MLPLNAKRFIGSTCQISAPGPYHVQDSPTRNLLNELDPIFKQNSCILMRNYRGIQLQGRALLILKRLYNYEKESDIQDNCI